MSLTENFEIGKRVAFYRREAGMSAEQLAQKAGGGLTRAVIANIENGRRSALSTDELLAIAWVLRVPPAAILLPIDQPYRKVEIGGEEVEVVELVTWFNNRFAIDERVHRTHPDAVPVGTVTVDGQAAAVGLKVADAGSNAVRIIDGLVALREYRKEQREREAEQAGRDTPPLSDAELSKQRERSESHIRGTENLLAALGVRFS